MFACLFRVVEKSGGTSGHYLKARLKWPTYLQRMAFLRSFQCTSPKTRVFTMTYEERKSDITFRTFFFPQKIFVFLSSQNFLQFQHNFRLFFSAHNKERPSDLNIAKFRIFRTFSELKLWFIFIYENIANQNSVSFFSVTIIFYKFRGWKCKRSVCLRYVCLLDFHDVKLHGCIAYLLFQIKYLNNYNGKWI